MAKPFNNFEWATNPTYVTGPDAGTATKVAPSAGEVEDGFVRDTAAVAQHMNWALGQIQEWTDYLAGIEYDSGFLGTAFHFTDSIIIDGDLDVGGALDVTGAIEGASYVQSPKQVTKMIPISSFRCVEGSSNVFESEYIGIYAYGGTGGYAQAYLDLPIGCSLNRVRCGVRSSSLGATKVQLDIDRVTFDKTGAGSGNTQGSNVTDGTAVGGAYTILDTGPFTAAIANTSQIRVKVTFNPDATSGDRDILSWCEVEYTTQHVDENT